MKKQTLIFLLIMLVTSSYAHAADSVPAKIIALEKAALEKWNNGDPSGYLSLSASDVVYFDPSLPQRLNGIEALTKYYEPVKGQIHVDRYEMLHPLVQSTEKMAVLTFNLVSYQGEKASRWNCTEVYRLEDDGNWKIIQTHWSPVQPFANK
ncbi:DUF4440 domain-containing protein [Prolixibacter sp. NT017]|uniref:YybH family protein n=1 Tax=Prolixibacter sp. NT017 TaxID=2652390 RepID=UPI0012819B86|nr:DUF4440 domain-containing protein [Prolixibacter sp. NT017]GET25959.1 hypothetical protein NT017_22880 [Prolixibacter sp. NT017]